VTGPQYFVATDEFGVERMSGDPIQWTVPSKADTSIDLTRPDGRPLVIREPIALLDSLDDVIWIAEAVGPVIETHGDGKIVVQAARLVHRTSWAPASAARFAIDCAEHAIGNAGEVVLPNGQSIAQALNDARAFLDSATDPAAHLGHLARVATIRRLKRENRLVADLAYGLSMEDISAELDTTLDVAWTSAASAADSLFAALEALRHLAFPRYVRARENLAVEQNAHGGTDTVQPGIFTTPWGPISIGADHESPYLPAAIAAREAALRAREAVRDRGGANAEIAERRWQAEHLRSSLS
jgi:hypothetical protein